MASQSLQPLLTSNRPLGLSDYSPTSSAASTPRSKDSFAASTRTVANAATATLVAPAAASHGVMQDLRAAIDNVSTCLTREVSGQERQRAQRHPTDLPKSTVDVCSLWGAKAQRSALQHQAQGHRVRAGMLSTWGMIGNVLFCLDYPLTVPLAAVCHTLKRAVGRPNMRTPSDAGVHLDMAAAALLDLREQLRHVWGAVPSWAKSSENASPSRRAVKTALADARRALTAVTDQARAHSNLKISTSELLTKHIRHTERILQAAEVRVLHWSDPRALAYQSLPCAEEIRYRCIMPFVETFQAKII